MNEHILVAMDWKNRSKEALKKNYRAAVSARAGAYSSYVALDAARAAFLAAADADAADADAADADAVEHWLDRYFEITGEDRQEYEKALEEMRK